MANEEQLAILKQGVEVWNAWRDENKATKVNLYCADFKQADLKGANLKGADLRSIDFRRANFDSFREEFREINWSKIFV